MTAGQMEASYLAPKAGTIVNGINAYRGWLSTGLARRALGTIENEVTDGGADGATITVPAQSAFVPGDWFALTHSQNPSIGFWFKGVPQFAAGAMEVPAKANIVSATDWYIFTDPDGVVTVVWFDVSGSDTVPSAVTALVNAGETGSAAVEADISGATTAAQVMAIVETALNAADIGIQSDDTAADGTSVLTVDAAGAEGNEWVFTEVVAHADGDATSPTGGEDDIASAPQECINQTDYQVAIDLTGDSSASDVEATIIAAVNAAENTIVVAEGNADLAGTFNIPTASAGTGDVVEFSNADVISLQEVWVLTEAVTSATFALVQASTIDAKVGGVSISGGPVLYDTDDPTTVAALITAINAVAVARTHNLYAEEGGDSSHLKLTQRKGGAEGALTFTVTGSATIEGNDLTGDTNTWTEMVSGAAANLPASGGPWEIGVDKSLIVDEDENLKIMLGKFVVDQDVETWRGRKRAATGKTRLTADGEFSLPAIGAGELGSDGRYITFGVWSVGSDAVVEPELYYV